MIRITNKKKLVSHTYYLNNSPLEWVDTYKYLGVKIQSKLNWSEHIQDASNKASRVLNLLRRSMYGCHHTAKKRAYMALVRPHLEYCSPVWSPYQHKLNEALEKVQKRAARWVCGSRWDRERYQWSKSYSDCCEELNWLTLENRRKLLSACQTYKIIHSLDCIPFSDYFKFKPPPLRSHTYSLLVSQSRVNAFRFSYFVHAPHLWNHLPHEIVNSLSLISFKISLCFYLKSILSLLLTINFCVHIFSFFTSIFIHLLNYILCSFCMLRGVRL